MIIPDFGFITRILNIKESDIQSLDKVFRDNVAYYYLELKSSLKECPFCHGALILVYLILFLSFQAQIDIQLLSWKCWVVISFIAYPWL